MFYTHLYVGILKSVSIRIMEEIHLSESKIMNRVEIEKIYPPQEMVNSRLILLKEKNWIDESSGNFFCLKKAKIVSKINLYLHKIYNLENTG